MQNPFYTLPDIKFHPTDHQLIHYYLHNKIFGLPFSCHTIIDNDLYDTQKPWDIWEFYKRQSKDDEDLYFSTALKKMSSKRKRICRRVSLGSWQGEDAAKEVQTDDTVIGFKKIYRYEKKGFEHDGEGIMHEYALLCHEEYVLCRIRKND
ncbi:hypothetical protein Pint_05678 [Pistacia integerrima]|uniref:Uncharacterized protein n=1 Tax=Pistacia integerrima TaxID=434235 RepID=A0ACC0Z275_9ROSI|nr:hypothetical protein Pint_05678 [Pistacia integerrima]